MVPKPENEGSVYSGDDTTQPIMGMVDKLPSIYSNSEGEECARLVKNGQLDNFTPTRTLKRQDLTNLINHDDIDSDSAHRPGRSSFRQTTMQRSKSEHRGRTTERINHGFGRAARSNSRDQIRIGDRVIIKDKYIGTCRYVGPIEEHDFQLPEVWYGVELDEKLTNNSGIFGSREYFTCAYGHGLMVLGAKIRKVKAPNVSFKNGPSTKSLRPSKSMSNLASTAGTTRTRVSVGADNWSQHSTVRSKNKFANQHPMATLNRIKQIQAMQQQPHFEQPRDPYGALLQTFNNGSGNSGYACDSLMRKSFERIVSQDHQPDYGLYRNQSLPPMRGHSPEAMMAKFSTLQRSTSAPHHQFTGRRPSFMSTGSGSISQSVSYSQDQVFEKMFYRTQTGAPLCESCATCRTCMPVVHKQQQPCTPDYNPAQNVAKQQPTMSLPRQFINRNQSFDYPVDAYQGRKVAFTSTSMSDSSSSGVSSSASSTTGSTSSLDEIITQTQSVEYEKWKSAYGLQRGRSMKKGLTKLSAALQS